MPSSVIGASVKRVEDPRLIRGRGRFVGNLDRPDALWMKVVRSDLPHGVITEIDTTEAIDSPGVVAVYTAADLGLRALPAGSPGADAGFGQPVPAADRVRFTGEAVAVVVAESDRQAADAAEKVWVEIDPLPAVVSPVDALSPDAPLLFPEMGTNVALDTTGQAGDDPLSDAQVVIRARFYNQRVAGVPLENSNCLAVPDGDRLDVWTGSQNAFVHRNAIARCLGIDRDLVRVRVPDMGGGFGVKIAPMPEQILCAAAAHRLSRPVRWQETREENLLSLPHGRGHYQTVELGARRDGTLTGLSVHVVAEAGAYVYFGAFLPEFSIMVANGAYHIPKVRFTYQSVVANTCPINAYRGAGRPEATSFLERCMDLLSEELGLDPIEVRRRNFIQPHQFPYRTPTDQLYDSGDYEKALDRAVDMADYESLRRDQAERAARGDRWRLGVGISTYVEITAPQGRTEWGSVTVNADDTVEIATGLSSHGQGHETALTQIVSDVLSVPMERITYIQGDTGRVATGGGTMGSRSLQLGGSAMLEAGRRVAEEGRRIFARLREAAIEDVVVAEGGRVAVAGSPDTAMSWGELAQAAGDGLSAELSLDQAEATFPFGAHIAVVEVDTETGDIRYLRHVAVDDCGKILNRRMVDGQIHGGIAQAAGQALLEQVLYDAEANPLTSNLTTYLVPTASNLPPVEIDHTVTPTTQNALGVKGIGEAGTIGATAAVQNAVIDALRPLGVDHLDMPLTPVRIWEALRDASP
ncbi:MAG: xanthine dehydrogenase family protein molybdopterin-binding subunit [Acidimicrobiia bacterium]|nr:xanthine dehydrogenase family protein molybdopterin-binding subunit [Acidimicrobiia bacterium]MYD40572.1 xanthine dehydrogenase family protein molybdopterin-binding subunit [Acidimicrobiia bacterium]MYG93127.1 xanthine dehydrogenase family protein molybdopterin-binding subunit [Acidimicrobiia bacterium]